jgi:hypothetical protein
VALGGGKAQVEVGAVALGGGKAQVEVGAVALGGAGRRLKAGRSGAWRSRAHVEGWALWARCTSKAGRWRQGAHVEERAHHGLE